MMAEQSPTTPPEPTLADLEREFEDLKRAITEDRSDRDHWRSGRWPMVHALAARIRIMKERVVS